MVAGAVMFDKKTAGDGGPKDCMVVVLVDIVEKVDMLEDMCWRLCCGMCGGCCWMLAMDGICWNWG